MSTNLQQGSVDLYDVCVSSRFSPKSLPLRVRITSNCTSSSCYTHWKASTIASSGRRFVHRPCSIGIDGMILKTNRSDSRHRGNSHPWRSKTGTAAMKEDAKLTNKQNNKPTIHDNNATVTSLVLWGVDSGPVTRGPSNDVTMSGN